MIKVGEMYAGLNEDMRWYRCVVRKAIDERQVCYILNKITFRLVYWQKKISIFLKRYENLSAVEYQQKLS